MQLWRRGFSPAALLTILFGTCLTPCVPAEAGVRAVWAIGDGDKIKSDDLRHPGRTKNSAWDGTTIARTK